MHFQVYFLDRRLLNHSTIALVARILSSPLKPCPAPSSTINSGHSVLLERFVHLFALFELHELIFIAVNWQCSRIITRIWPYLASSIFLTTGTDVAGFFFFLGLAALGLRWFGV